jgi:hypothetical protein
MLLKSEVRMPACTWYRGDMTKRALKPVAVPATTPLDDHVIEIMGHEFDKFIAQITPENSHSHLRRLMGMLVREGRMTLRRLIEYTRDKNWAFDADEALRDIAAEMQQRREHPPEILQSYLICFPKPARKRGRRETDNLLRDQCVAICTAIARERWQAVLPFTRNPDVTDAPSICSLMSRVCYSRGIKTMAEKRVKQVYDRFAPFLPVHQGWLTIKAGSAI